ncbi:MAG TPA: IS1 family transposase [Terriglobales bacterium]|jgi:IS1 family transposase/transposase-like protein|nr:IS1 family transposase [Terriglobales bacterium]
MTFIAVRCPHCQSDQIVKRGKTTRGTQRYLCQNTLGTKGSFLLDSGNRGCLPAVKHTINNMRLNASGVRETPRSLPICPNTVLRALKKKATVLESVNTALLRTLHPAEVAWDMERAGEAEVDAMWSFVGNKGNPRWLWHAIDHHTGKVFAYVFGRRTDAVFVQRKTLLEPFGLTRYCTDHGGAYTWHLDPDVPRPRETQYAANRAHTSDLTDAHEALGSQDHWLVENDPDARHRPWLVCQPLCLWTGGVNMAISTFETLPLREAFTPSDLRPTALPQRNDSTPARG